MAEQFFTRGWVRFAATAPTRAWAQAAAQLVAPALAAPGADWRCDGTWFAGVNLLPNGPDGAIPAVGAAPLSGPAVDFVAQTLGLGATAWDRGQLSVVRPGYPRHGAEESEAAFRFRRDRAAAHVDGLLRDGARRRRLGERHGFVLGLPLGPMVEGASPMVIWEGSHETMCEAFTAALAGVDPARWGAVDLTDVYQEARARCFARARPVPITAGIGEAYVVHRLALHGVAPWRAAHDAPARAIAYFRPEPSATSADWLTAP